MDYWCPIETEKHVWRAQCFSIKDRSTAYIIFSFSHAMIDGLSAYAIAKDFITIANQIKSGQYDDHTNALPLVALSEEEFSSHATQISTLATAIQQWPYQTRDRGIQFRKTGNIDVCLDSGELANIRPVLKTKKLSINDFLNGVLIKMLRDHKPDDLEQIVLHTPVNLRTFGKTKIGPEHVLCATRLINTYHTLESTVSDILTNAADYQQQLITKIRQQEQQPDDEINTEERLETYMIRCKTPRDAFFMGFCISNLGVINFGTQPADHLQVQSFNFSGGRQASDCMMFINISAYGDQMHLTFNFTEPMLQKSWVQRFADDFVRTIYEANRALRSSPTPT